MIIQYTCPNCHVISDVNPKEYTEICEYSDIETWRPSWAKVSFRKMICPVCKEETEVEIDTEYLERKPRKVDRLCI